MTRKTEHAHAQKVSGGGILTHFLSIIWVVLQNLFQQSAVFLNCMPCRKARPVFLYLHPLLRHDGLAKPFSVSTWCPPAPCPHYDRKSPSAVPLSSWKYSHLFGTGFSLVSCIQSIKLDNFFSWPISSDFPFTSVLTKASWPPFRGFLIASPCGFLPFPPSPLLIIPMYLYIISFYGDLPLRIPLITLPLSRVNNYFGLSRKLQRL